MAKLLDQIHRPQDLHGLSDRELQQVAEELRAELIDTIQRVGGHFGSNLGAVELTVALHSVFDSPRDKILWDVGHQAYPHKMLTGRRERLPTIRQLGGLAPFCHRDESEHDVFTVGHGGTSISAALGLALARDLQGGKEEIVAVIGDGAMTAGMALEALNHAGDLRTRLIVVLNDNGMSISPNVGGISHYLIRLRADPHYQTAKERFEALMNFVPLGNAMVEAVERFKGGLKHLLIPGMLFEDLGLTYLGPVDGHNVRELREALQDARNVHGPVLVHVLTTKGKGVKAAEENQVQYHALTPPCPTSGPRPPTYTEVFAQTLIDLAREDERIVAITAAMLEGTGLSRFQQEFPERCFDVGMAEQHAVTLAAGLAAGGRRPVVAIYSTFLQRSFDQILHDVCLPNLPVVFALDRSGLVGEDGPTHHGAFDLSYLRLMPNIVLAAPKDENEFRHLLKTALAYTAGPMAVRYPRGTGQGVAMDSELKRIPIGRGEVLREGSEVALLAVGTMVPVALEAADHLADVGLSATVANARFIKPLDEALLQDLAQRHEVLVTLEENALCGGFGSAVLEALQRLKGAAVRVCCLGLPDAFVEHGDRPSLLKRQGLDAASVAQRVRGFWHESLKAGTEASPSTAGTEASPYSAAADKRRGLLRVVGA